MDRRLVAVVVDDDARARTELAQLLEAGDVDVEVVHANNGLAALELLEKSTVDLLFADEEIPGMTGIRLLQMTRERWPRVVRVMMTSTPDPHLFLDAANRAGVFRILLRSLENAARHDLVTEALTEAVTRRTAVLDAQVRVLVADDEPDVRRLLIEPLQGTHVDLVEAADGQQALEVMQRDPAHIVLADVVMPRLSGIALLERIRKQWPRTFRVVLTGRLHPEVLLEGIHRAGAHRFLPKPVEAERVRDLVLGLAEHLVTPPRG